MISSANFEGLDVGSHFLLGFLALAAGRIKSEVSGPLLSWETEDGQEEDGTILEEEQGTRVMPSMPDWVKGMLQIKKSGFRGRICRMESVGIGSLLLRPLLCWGPPSFCLISP